MSSVGVLLVLLGCLGFTTGRISEYQLQSETLSRCELLRAEGEAQQQDHVYQCGEDGRFRHMQCSHGGVVCWCVNADGLEIPHTRQNGSTPHCLSTCQLHRQQALLSDAQVVPVCEESGGYRPVQCERTRAQCWCVDRDGMEVYGTRQDSSEPHRCPGSCEIRQRSLLHGAGERSPPQCSAGGEFLPVQCKFINTTDMTVIDLLHAYNRQPEAFQTFSGFRKRYQEVSSYCFCADSRGREVSGTGLELLLDNVYDTAFSTTPPGGSFSQSNMYRILQRRFLAVHLALSGRFRCPTKCEREKWSGLKAGNVFVPVCSATGDYEPQQCQAGGQCWCVDADGSEVLGTRMLGGKPDCKNIAGECLSERRRALSQLFSGSYSPLNQLDMSSVGPAATHGSLVPLNPCSPEARELLSRSGLLQSVPEVEQPTVGELLADVIQGLFPSGALALKALSMTTNPKRLTENLFGGKFLKNVGNFNFSGAVGPRGTFSFNAVFDKVGLVGVAGDLVQLAEIFSRGEKVNLDQAVLDRYGRVVNLKENQRAIELLGRIFEKEQFFITLQDIITLSKAEDSVELGSFIRAALQSLQPGVCDKDPVNPHVPRCTAEGVYQQLQCQGSQCWCVNPRSGAEIPGTRSSSTTRCPSQCEQERDVALKLKASLSAGMQTFIPKCEADGSFTPVQCFGTSCFCVDTQGRKSRAFTLGAEQQCPSDCQQAAEQRFLSAVRSLLSGAAALSELSHVYVPRCNSDGSWHHIQCDGPPEQAFRFYRQWVEVNGGGQETPLSEVVGVLRSYSMQAAAMASFSAFVKQLFDARHQKVFPALSGYSELSEVPEEILAGDQDAVFGPSVFQNPLSLWQLLRGNSSSYPGRLSDFSLPLGDVRLRRCWCITGKGEELPNSKAAVGEIPKCPGPCSLVARQVAQFVQAADELISVSNISHVPLGYGFLLAKGLTFTPEELQGDVSPAMLGSEQLLSSSDSALHLAARSTLRFYWQSRRRAGEEREALLLGYQPYSPQCDAYGRWLPTQCHQSTGHCWCVDEEGEYVPGSLTSWSTQPPQCGAPCQRARAQALISGWSDATLSVSYIPSCTESGEYSVLQKEGADSEPAACVSPITGRALQPASRNQSGQFHCPGWCKMLKSLVLSREAGTGYDPECQADGQLFSPVQCDTESCWCVSHSRQELVQSRVARNTGNTPACDAPECPLPYGGTLVSQGSIVCSEHHEGGRRRQRCRLLCYHGYDSAFPPDGFLCDTESRAWLSETPQTHACQKVQLLQVIRVVSLLQLTLKPVQQTCSSQQTQLQLNFIQNLKARGLCNLQVSYSEQQLSVGVCDSSPVRLECESEDRAKVEITWTVRLSELPVKALPDLHDVEAAFGRLYEGFTDLLQNSLYSPNATVISSPAVHFTCTRGFWRLPGSPACVACPAGSYFSSSGCSPCPKGWYQEQQGKDFCKQCPTGRSTADRGAFSRSHCVAQCELSSMACFHTLRRDEQTGRQVCVGRRGESLLWTSLLQNLTEEQCPVLDKFESVPRSQWDVGAADTVTLSSEFSDAEDKNLLRKCFTDCAMNDMCHHLAIHTEGDRTQCDSYSTDAANVKCQASGQSNGFLGNPAAEAYQNLSCTVKVKDNRGQDLLVLRKKGHEFNTQSKKAFEKLAFGRSGVGVYRTLVFGAERASLTDVHRFCQDTCDGESCCDGFILNENVLNGGSIMCGMLSYPDTFMCSDLDWDADATSDVRRACQAGVEYDEERKRFTFSLGGQNFTISDVALPAASRNQTGYQASLIGFQRVYFWRDSDLTTRPKSSPSCAGISPPETSGKLLTDTVKAAFSIVDDNSVRVDSAQKIPVLQYRVFKHQYSSQQAELWCLKRCQDESLCHVAEIGDDHLAYYTCTLYPNTRVCGAYDKPLRQDCSLVLPHIPLKAYSRNVDLTGSVKSFYTRTMFKKMVSYSVRSRVTLTSKPITEGFFECERRCDEDPCCRGIGYVRDSQSNSAAVVCLTLNSLGVQTCGEGERTRWRIMDCSTSTVETAAFPFGWYEKPVTQWTRTPELCPDFQLRRPTRDVSISEWERLGPSSLLVDPSVSAYDVVHISKDASEGQDRSRDWCLSACMGSPSCSLVSLDLREAAVRCVFYPDTHTCITHASQKTCRVLIKEPAAYVYLRKDMKPQLTSVLVPPHGEVTGESLFTLVGSDRKSVTRFLGVPYARPPIGALRFSSPLPADWTGMWNATFPRASCLQPGDTESLMSSEDCLYLNIFVPNPGRANASVLLFFHNGPSYLDGSQLAAIGDVIVITAGYRTAALGFLSTGTSSEENFGLRDQAAALKWVQDNIAYLGGDPGSVTLGADGSGADVASMHLISTGEPRHFHRLLLMGGSVFSPAATASRSKAQNQAQRLAQEVGCSSTSPQQMLLCLRGVTAQILNAAQTKLLAVSGPMQAWAPLLRESISSALINTALHGVDLMVGSSAEDGLINRAKNIKKAEELQGRTESKTAFYQALSNSLGGDQDNVFVKEASTWFYSLQHDPTPAGYSQFSRALDKATRDLFIICPTVKMASFWAAHTRSNVFMYHLPESTAQNSADLSPSEDTLLLFGIPHQTNMYKMFTAGERKLSLQVMSYVTNFIKTGNPNTPHPYSHVTFGDTLPPWPRFVSQPKGDNYKELETRLRNRKGLRRSECSFWRDYVPNLSSSTEKLLRGLAADTTASSTAQTNFVNFQATVTQSKPKSDKDAYS